MENEAGEDNNSLESLLAVLDRSITNYWETQGNEEGTIALSIYEQTIAIACLANELGISCAALNHTSEVLISDTKFAAAELLRDYDDNGRRKGFGLASDTFALEAQLELSRGEFKKARQNLRVSLKLSGRSGGVSGLTIAQEQTYAFMHLALLNFAPEDEAYKVGSMDVPEFISLNEYLSSLSDLDSPENGPHLLLKAYLDIVNRLSRTPVSPEELRMLAAHLETFDYIDAAEVDQVNLSIRNAQLGQMKGRFVVFPLRQALQHVLNQPTAGVASELVYQLLELPTGARYVGLSPYVEVAAATHNSLAGDLYESALLKFIPDGYPEVLDIEVKSETLVALSRWQAMLYEGEALDRGEQYRRYISYMQNSDLLDKNGHHYLANTEVFNAYCRACNLADDSDNLKRGFTIALQAAAKQRKFELPGVYYIPKDGQLVGIYLKWLAKLDLNTALAELNSLAKADHTLEPEKTRLGGVVGLGLGLREIELENLDQVEQVVNCLAEATDVFSGRVALALLSHDGDFEGYQPVRPIAAGLVPETDLGHDTLEASHVEDYVVQTILTNIAAERARFGDYAGARQIMLHLDPYKQLRAVGTILVDQLDESIRKRIYEEKLLID